MKQNQAFTGLLMLLAFALPAPSTALVSDFVPQSVGAGNPELHINAGSVMTLKSARVDQVAGSTSYLVMKWGQLPMRFTMKTDGQTKVTKRYGGAAAIEQIKVGDYIDAEGDFFVGSDFFGLTARTIKDWSLQEESGTFSGKILEVNENTLVLQTPAKNIVVQSTGATTIKKGIVTIPWNRLVKGDTVILADGVYDYSKNTLTAGQLIIFQQKNDFTPRNFEGTLKSIGGTGLPTTLVVTVDGKDYSVYLASGTPVLSKNRKPAVLARFVAGDMVRFYGAIREEDKTLSDQLVVPAEVVRNLSL